MNEQVTRLSVNVNADCAAHLEAMKAQGVSATEVVRQALALHKCTHDGGRVVMPSEEDPGRLARRYRDRLRSVTLSPAVLAEIHRQEAAAAAGICACGAAPDEAHSPDCDSKP